MRDSQRTLVSSGLYILVLMILWVLISPVIVILTALRLVRYTVHHFASIFRPDLIPINNALDGVICQFPNSARVAFNGSVVFDLQGKLEVKVFRKHFYELFLSTPDLRHRYRNLFCYFVQWGFYCFKKRVDEINLEERIHEEYLDVKSDKESDEFMGRWLETNDYGDNPNWEILLLHIRRSNDIHNNDVKTKVLYKLDHGLSDGYTLVHLVERLTGVKSPYLVQESNIGFFQKIEIFLQSPRIIADTLVDLATTRVLPWGNEKRKDYGIFISFATLDLEKVKEVRRLAKCHFNTVLGVIQGLSLKKFFLTKLKEKMCSADGNMNKVQDELPEYTFIPSPTGLPMHPAMTKGTMGNHLSVSFFRMRLNEEDPAVALLKAEEDFLKVQGNGFSEMMSYVFLESIWGVPPFIFRISKEIAIKLRVISNISHAFSPLLLSNEPYQLLGIPVEHMYMPLQPLSTVLSSGRKYKVLLTMVQKSSGDIIFCNVSYGLKGMLTIPVSNGGRLDVSVSGDVDSFENKEDLDYFTQVMMKDSLDELYSACKSRHKLME